MTKVTSISILEAAAETQRARAKTYDQASGERSAGAIATAFNAITRRNRATDRPMTESEAWLFLQLLKQVRLFAAPGYHSDSAEDNVSYGSLMAEAKALEAADPLAWPFINVPKEPLTQTPEMPAFVPCATCADKPCRATDSCSIDGLTLSDGGTAGVVTRDLPPLPPLRAPAALAAGVPLRPRR